MATCVDSIFNTYDVIEIDNYVILNTSQTFHFREYYIFVYRFGQKNAEPNIGKIFKNIIIVITKLEYCKKFYFLPTT